MKKRILAALLSLVLIFAMFPASAVAEEGNSSDSVQKVLNDANLSVSMKTANTEETVLAWLGTAIWDIDGLTDVIEENYKLNADTAKTSVTIATRTSTDSGSSFRAAVAGTADDTDGTNGSLDFALILDDTSIATGTCTVTATAYENAYASIATDTSGNDHIMLKAADGQSFASGESLVAEAYTTSTDDIIRAVRAGGYINAIAVTPGELDVPINTQDSVKFHLTQNDIQQFQETSSSRRLIGYHVWADSKWADPIWADPIWADPIWADPIWADAISKKLNAGEQEVSLGSMVRINGTSYIVATILSSDTPGATWNSDYKVVYFMSIYDNYGIMVALKNGNIASISNFNLSDQFDENAQRYVSIGGVKYNAFGWFGDDIALLYDMDGNLAGTYTAKVELNGKTIAMANFRPGYSPDELKAKNSVGTATDIGNAVIFTVGNTGYVATPVWASDISVKDSSGNTVALNGTADLSVSFASTTATNAIFAHSAGNGGTDIGTVDAANGTATISISSCSPFYVVSVSAVGEPKEEDVITLIPEDTTTSPKTGEKNPFVPCLFLLGVSATGMIASIVYDRKRKQLK